MMQADEIEFGWAFRNGMRRLASAVTIIASGHANGRAGMVATSVMSVSMEPPSLVVGVNRTTGVWEHIQQTGRFSVNLLATRHAALVKIFSGTLRGEERFVSGDWLADALSTPFLQDATVSFVCRKDASFDYGTHTLFVGAVEDVRLHENANDEVLLWREGQFAGVAPLQIVI